jgi:hypothetical protein
MEKTDVENVVRMIENLMAIQSGSDVVSTAEYIAFEKLLNDLIAIINVTFQNKTFKDDAICTILFNKRLKPGKIEYDNNNLFILGEYLKDLKCGIDIQHKNNYRTLILDVLTDSFSAIGPWINKYEIETTHDVGRRISIHLMDRVTAIKSLFWIDLLNGKSVPSRDIRPHFAMILRQAIELLWKEALGYIDIVDQQGNTVKKFTQIGMKFITKTKCCGHDWKINLPIPIKTIELINQWSNNFVHNPYIAGLHIQWFVLKQFMRLATPSKNKTKIFIDCISLQNISWKACPNISIENYLAMRAEFEIFVLKQNSSVTVKWVDDYTNIQSYIKTLGSEPMKSDVNALRIKYCFKNLSDLWRNLWHQLATLILLILKHSFRK